MNLEKGDELIITRLPNGRWSPQLRLAGQDEPYDLGREFKTEEIAEGWLETSEATNLIGQFITKYRVKPE